ncbi:MAG: hypothetical protein H6717_34050 [Polyangiaceae bacterium]|nr:hypothetical protein [Polyangiaceae bacterium]
MSAHGDELLVVSIVADGDANTVTVQDRDDRETFLVRVSESDGISVLEMPELNVWLKRKGKFPWAMVRIAELVQQNRRTDIGFPLRIELEEE